MVQMGNLISMGQMMKMAKHYWDKVCDKRINHNPWTGILPLSSGEEGGVALSGSRCWDEHLALTLGREWGWLIPPFKKSYSRMLSFPWRKEWSLDLKSYVWINWNPFLYWALCARRGAKLIISYISFTLHNTWGQGSASYNHGPNPVPGMTL